MGETGSNIVDFGEGKNLCFVLHSSERGGEDNTIEVPLKIRSGCAAGRVIYRPKSLAG
jgi:hypothetical protein